MGFLHGISHVLGKLAVELYARGLSVRDIEDAPCDASRDPLLSRSAVSELEAGEVVDENEVPSRGLTRDELHLVCWEWVWS